MILAPCYLHSIGMESIKVQVDEQLEQLTIHSALIMQDISLIPGQFKVFQTSLGTRLIGCNPAHRLFPGTARENEPEYEDYTGQNSSSHRSPPNFLHLQ